MASNQERLFIAHPVIPDSSKLRFSQGCRSFDLKLFNAAAKADRRLIDSITNLGVFLKRLEAHQKELNQKLSLNPLLERAKENLRLTEPLKLWPQTSPNAPNPLPAFSLVAA